MDCTLTLVADLYMTVNALRFSETVLLQMCVRARVTVCVLDCNLQWSILFDGWMRTKIFQIYIKPAQDCLSISQTPK